MRHVTQTAVIASGDTLSSAVDLRNMTEIGLWAPGLTSCSVMLRVGYAAGGAVGQTEPNSADYLPLVDPASLAAVWTWPASVGSRAVRLTTALAGFSHAKIETSVAQAAGRTFNIVGRTY